MGGRRGGRFPTVTSAEVQRLAQEEKEQEKFDQIQQFGFNTQSIRKPSTVREHKLGELCVAKDEFDNVVGPPQNMRLFYDFRHNVWACKYLCAFWGRNAYTTTPKKKPARPIQVVEATVIWDVFCHIDITTPRADFLWHGDIEGPHIVVEGVKTQADRYTKKPKHNCYALDPEEVYKLALGAHSCAQRGVAPGDEWPDFILDKLRQAIRDV